MEFRLEIISSTNFIKMKDGCVWEDQITTALKKEDLISQIPQCIIELRQKIRYKI